MQYKALITLLAALTAVVVLAAVAAAMPEESQDTTSAADMSDLAAMAMPKAVMMTISAGNMTDGNMTFTVPYAARVQQMDNKEIAIVATYNKPLSGSSNASTGIGMISMEDALPATATIDYVNRTSIPVAGANAVVALQDFKMTGGSKGKGTYNFQFGSITVYLPDGTAKTMKLEKPVRMSVSVSQMKLSIEAHPALAGMMAGLFKSGTVFPAGSAPVRLNDILAAK